jgi:hypothetical protein
LLKLLIAEQGSDRMLRFAEAEDDRNKVVSVLARIEARSAIARLLKSLRMNADEATLALDALAAEARQDV